MDDIKGLKWDKNEIELIKQCKRIDKYMMDLMSCSMYRIAKLYNQIMFGVIRDLTVLFIIYSIAILLSGRVYRLVTIILCGLYYGYIIFDGIIEWYKSYNMVKQSKRECIIKMVDMVEKHHANSNEHVELSYMTLVYEKYKLEDKEFKTVEEKQEDNND